MPNQDPSHPIAISPVSGRVRVLFHGEVVVDTTAALELREATYPAVLYLPRADARIEAFELSPRQSRCPHKGQASSYSLRAGGKTASDVVWSYENPLPLVQQIKGHFAFYPQHVTVERLAA